MTGQRINSWSNLKPNPSHGHRSLIQASSSATEGEGYGFIAPNGGVKDVFVRSLTLQMNTRFRCTAPAQSIAISQASCTSWPEPALFPDPGEAYCGLPHHSIAEPSTSTAGPYERALRDRRDARMDAVGTVLALDIRNVFAGAQKPSATRGEPQ
jgi:hypothetical protein